MRRFGSLWQKLRLSVRVLAKSPTATTLSLVSLALGIGITTAMFSFVDATYLRSMPFERPGDVLKLESRGDDGRSFLYNWPDYQDMVRAAQGVADLSAYQRRAVMLAGDEDSQLLLAYPVTPNHFSFLGVKLNSVGGQYFSVMGTRVLAGRGIEPNDREGGPLVAVVSQTFTRQIFGGRNPVGEWISIDGKMRQVVGVAEDGPSSGSNVHEAPAPYLYLPYAQAPSGDVTLLVETFGDPKALGPAILRELKKFDPGVFVFSSTTLREHMDQALFTDRLAVSVASGLGAIGLLLTAAGLFGVIQYGVSRRTREIGLRVALGARPADVQRMILLESLRISAWGIPIGLLLLWAAARSVQSLLLGVTALDPLAYAASSALAVAIALAAAWLPAMRAARVDPLTALRSE